MPGRIRPDANLPTRLSREQFSDLLIGLQRSFRQIGQYTDEAYNEDVVRDASSAVNTSDIAGMLSGATFNYSTGTAAPGSGTFTANHFRRNTTPTELGTAPNKYVILGWVCVTGGTPGTWLQCRTLTGN